MDVWQKSKLNVSQPIHWGLRRFPPVVGLNSMKKLKTIKLKGKEYVQVNERVAYFNETYPQGAITSEATFNGDTVYFKATVFPEAGFNERFFTGHSFGRINEEKALEKLETVAVGRALAFMSIGIVESIASADEMNKFYDKGALEIAPHCEICGKTANKVKWGWSCPDWKAHQDKGEKPKMVQDAPVLDENTVNFINSLP